VGEAGGPLRREISLSHRTREHYMPSCIPSYIGEIHHEPKHNLRTHWGSPSLRGHPPYRHQDHAGRDRSVRRTAAHVPLAGRDLRHQRCDEDRRESRGGGEGMDHTVRPCRDVHDQRHPLCLPPRPGAGGPAGHPEVCGRLGDGRSHPDTRPLHRSQY